MTPLFPDDVESSADLSLDGRYRFSLVRRWGPGPLACWVMCNPSTADAEVEDATTRQVKHFTNAAGYSGFVIVNLFALRSKDPKNLKGLSYEDLSPVEAREIVSLTIRSARVGPIIAAWGIPPVTKDAVLRAVGHVLVATEHVGKHLHCLAVTKANHPRHPLYLPHTLTLGRWTP